MLHPKDMCMPQQDDAEPLKTNNLEEMIDNLCKKLRCSLIALDLEKLDYARDMLSKLQNREIFLRILGPDQDDDLEMDELLQQENVLQLDATPSSSSRRNCEEFGEEECICRKHLAETYEDLPEDAWHGYFTGFNILSETEEFNMNENKKCIELTKNDCDEDMDAYLRSGIRCFVIDLFSGTEIENQMLIVRLRENELRISKEFGFPVTATLIAKISPRLQYTGLMNPPDAVVELAKGDEITLSTNRYWSTRGNRRRVYVNARFLLDDVKNCDFLLIGPTLQLQVKQARPDRLRCTVFEAGQLSSRLPVLFPPKCQKFRVSVEELEDITFAKEVGINVIVSYIIGSKEYFEELQECLRLLQCEKMRLGARVVLNEIKGCEDDMVWAANSYDGFLIELNPQQPENEQEPCEIMHLCPAAEKFIERVFELKKPIILDPTPISLHRIIVDPEHYLYIFYYPDKYVFKCDRSLNSFYFHYLQSARFAYMPDEQLAKLTICDDSHTGSDSLARACAAATIETNTVAIFVCAMTGRMAAKISHYRPKVPIIFITRMKSAGDFISMYHHVVMLYYRGKEDEEHRKSLFKHILYGLVYAKSRRLVEHEDNVILVYGKEEGTKFPDKYIVYKYHEKHFAEHLNKTLFSS